MINSLKTTGELFLFLVHEDVGVVGNSSLSLVHDNARKGGSASLVIPKPI